jgi:hypothetical protein
LSRVLVAKDSGKSLRELPPATGSASHRPSSRTSRPGATATGGSLACETYVACGSRLRTADPTLSTPVAPPRDKCRCRVRRAGLRRCAAIVTAPADETLQGGSAERSGVERGPRQRPRPTRAPARPYLHDGAGDWGGDSAAYGRDGTKMAPGVSPTAPSICPKAMCRQ